MTLKPITYSQLKEAIIIGLEGDNDVYHFFHEGVKVENISDMAEDIYNRIREYGEYGNLILIGVYEKESLIGYIVRLGYLLVSFALSVKFRTKEYLKDFFRFIKGEFNGDFFCYLENVNLRAIKWLEKNNMKTIYSNNHITKLQCQQ